MEKGLFITLEGTDGSGKTTQIRLMEQYFKERGLDAVVLREPGGTIIGEKIRTVILDPKNTEMSNMTEMLLYASARAQIVSQVIKPQLSLGNIVICDRFIDSSYVYQSFARGIDFEIVDIVNKIALDGIEPDITFFFDISPRDALNRRIHRVKKDRIEQEKIEFYQKVYEGYKKLVPMFPDRIKAINAISDKLSIFEEVKVYLDKLLNI